MALKAKGMTLPNPLVGALVVKNSRIVGKGYHKCAGAPHAEVEAIDKAGKLARGADLYVTLEPCCHFGRTPPCTDEIIEAGIKKVFVGMIDPNPLNNGKGISMLKEHGIKAEVGFLEDKLNKINESFIKYITKKLPFVTVKVGQSLDGKIATKTGDSHWVTSDKSRERAHKLRNDYDAIMVGVNTILRDNPYLNSSNHKKPITRIIIDSHLSTPASANVFSRKGEVIIATIKVPAGQQTENRDLLSQKAKILDIKDHNGQLNLHDLFKKLARLEISNILVEGGGSLIGSLFDAGFVDKVLFFIAPKIIGGKDAISSVMGKGISLMDKAVKLKDIKIEKIGEDILVEGYVKKTQIGTDARVK